VTLIDPLPKAVVAAIKQVYMGTEPIDQRFVSYQNKWLARSRETAKAGAEAMCAYSGQPTACITEVLADDYWIFFLQNTKQNAPTGNWFWPKS